MKIYTKAIQFISANLQRNHALGNASSVSCFATYRYTIADKVYLLLFSLSRARACS